MTITKRYGGAYRSELFVFSLTAHDPGMSTAHDADLRGLWVPIVTPFHERGGVDASSLERLARRILQEGATGLVALGTTGEPATQTAQERRLVVEVCDAACRAAGRRLIVGAGTNDTSRTIDAIGELTAGTGAIAALVVVPYYTRPSEEAVVEHFAMVADASPVPLVAYNVPYRTGRGLGARALAAVADHPRIVGLKQAVGALDSDTLDVLARTTGRLQVLAGDDAFIAPTILLGGVGAIAAAANVATAAFVELTSAALTGNWASAAALAAALLPVVTIGFSEPNPAVWKGALARRGVIASGGLRRPMTAASAAAVDALVQVLDELGASPDRQHGDVV